MNLILGFCRPHASAQSLLMINTQVKCPVFLWVWLQFELVYDDPGTKVLMMLPITSSLYFARRFDREGDEEVGRY